VLEKPIVSHEQHFLEKGCGVVNMSC